jgi:hypothetical protein
MIDVGQLLLVPPAHVVRSAHYKGSLGGKDAGIPLPIDACTVLGTMVLAVTMVRARQTKVVQQQQVLDTLTAIFNAVPLTCAFELVRGSVTVRVAHNVVNPADLASLLETKRWTARPGSLRNDSVANVSRLVPFPSSTHDIA